MLVWVWVVEVLEFNHRKKMVMMSTLILAVLVLLVVASLSPPARRFFKSILAYGGAQADRAADSVRNVDPLGVYRTQIENAVENSRNASSVVEKAAKQLVSLETQIADGLKEQTRLTNRLQAVVDQGDPNKTAAKYAADLSRVEEQLEANKQQRDIAQDQYDDNLKLVTRFEDQIKKARQEVKDMGLQLQQSQAEKDLHQMTASLKDKLSLGDLSEARQRVKDQIDANKGAARAARDLNGGSIAEESDDELESNASVQAVLARFQKKQENV